MEGASAQAMQEFGPEGELSPLPKTPRRGLVRRLDPSLPAHLQQDPAFIDAARHSRRVRLLRRAIPLGSALVLTFFVFRSVVGLFGAPDLAADDVGIQGRKIVMEKPKLSGYKRDGRSYELTATSATQDITTPNTVELDSLTARMQTGKEGWANLKGARGIYDSKIERLEVDGGVNVQTETGVDAKMKDARIEFKAGTIVTDKPVEVKSPQGDVEADRMEVLDNGRRLVFEGRVRSIFVNPQKRAGQSGAGETPEAPAAATPNTD